jgi:signal transduction histidine kinase
MDNALKFSHPGVVPLVRTATGAGDWVRIEVVNRGAAFSSGELARLFQCFGRLGRHGSVPGVGLGLFTSRQLIEFLGGRMGVANGRRTVTFWIELPSVNAYVQVHQAPRRGRKPSSARQLRR